MAVLEAMVVAVAAAVGMAVEAVAAGEAEQQAMLRQAPC